MGGRPLAAGVVRGAPRYARWRRCCGRAEEARCPGGGSDVDDHIGTVTAPGYLAVWIFYAGRDDMQTLLASRLELDEARERNPALDMVYAALQETATGLRTTVTELHPQVLAQLGLTPAVRELLRQCEPAPTWPSRPSSRMRVNTSRRRCRTGRRACC
jgi:hypothetical protein